MRVGIGLECSLAFTGSSNRRNRRRPSLSARGIVMRLLLSMLLILLCIQQASNAASSIPNGAVFAADLFVRFDCKEQSRDDFEKEIEAFFLQNNFKTLNLAMIQHQHQVYLLETDIVAIDSNLRIVKLRSYPTMKTTFLLTLSSMPPTKRLDSLEKDILTFFSDKLRCDSRETLRAENGSERIKYYEREIERVQGLFNEADRIKNGNPI